MVYLNHNEREFSAAHFQGGSYIYHKDLIEILEKNRIVFPDNLQLITVCNRPEEAILIRQLEINNIPYINKAGQEKDWNNVKKIGYILESLPEINTDIVLILDANDVLLCPAITDIVNKFEQQTKKLIFGATKINFPNKIIDKISDRDWRGAFRYLNAGTCIGYTEYCLEFYKKCQNLVNDSEIYNPFMSEQLIIRHVFDEEKEFVDFDFKCDFFQTFDGVFIKQNDGKNIIT